MQGKISKQRNPLFFTKFPLAYRMYEGNLEDKVLFALRSQNVR